MERLKAIKLEKHHVWQITFVVLIITICVIQYKMNGVPD